MANNPTQNKPATVTETKAPEPTPTPPPAVEVTPPATVFNDGKFNQKIERLAAIAKDTGVVGGSETKDGETTKFGVNGPLWFKQVVQPLVDRYNAKERSVELFNSLMSIEETVPTVNTLPWNPHNQ